MGDNLCNSTNILVKHIGFMKWETFDITFKVKNNGR